MKTKQLFLISLLFTSIISFGQEQCGTMKILEEKIKSDPAFKEKMLQIEKQNQEWIEKNGRGFKKSSEKQIKGSDKLSKTALNVTNLCGYDNTQYTEIEAPISENVIVSPIDNCVYGGEYVSVTNLIAGYTYRISVSSDLFDTQITIYTAGGGNAVAFNDDWQGSTQSEIYFTPLASGDYDILIDEYNCISNTKCASLEVELWYIPRPVITIPVVVHVMYYQNDALGTGTNISDAQIQSQIDVLNEDFRRLNSNIYSVPAAFRGVSADPLIQFCLAQQDPNGNFTTGINRYPVNGFSEPTTNYIDANYKPATIWDRNKYLNIWSCDISNSGNQILGYAQFPGEPISAAFPNPELTDGVVVLYSTVGLSGSNLINYNLGKNCTHEVGHWLNLKHIWGDETGCDADDYVIDTPPQSFDSNSRMIFPNSCPSFPVFNDACSPNYPGIMFMNYMDYAFDQCKSMFTYGQSNRMDAALFNQRAGLLTSQGCIPGSLSSIEFNNFKVPVFPNPTTSAVFFDNTKHEFAEVQVFNYLGQEVAREQLTGAVANQEINLSNLSAGVYVLKFHNGTSTATAKVVKQ